MGFGLEIANTWKKVFNGSEGWEICKRVILEIGILCPGIKEHLVFASLNDHLNDGNAHEVTEFDGGTGVRQLVNRKYEFAFRLVENMVEIIDDIGANQAAAVDTYKL